MYDLWLASFTLPVPPTLLISVPIAFAAPNFRINYTICLSCFKKKNPNLFT